VLINNAGIMRIENILDQPDDLADVEATISTNLLGPIRLTAALLPHLRQQAEATIANVSSGLAFVPLDTFIAETIANLQRQPDAQENCAEAVGLLRRAAESGQYDQVFCALNHN